MQQRQPRLGDILDDYCPRERRLTNHAVVAMIGEDIRLTRCTTCDSEHDYKHARMPRLRKKNELVGGPAIILPTPKRIVHEAAVPVALAVSTQLEEGLPELSEPVFEILPVAAAQASLENNDTFGNVIERPAVEEGPVHRQLIRAQLPKHDGQAPTGRQTPDFTIRQPTGRPGRFQRRPQRGGMFTGPSDRANGNAAGNGNGRGMRPAGHPPLGSRNANRQGGRNRSK